jgi:hypothetical protein
VKLGPCAALALLSCILSPAASQAATEKVDTALVLAVDVSGSVDDKRYVLQMEGIASAFEDKTVQQAILTGPHHAMLVTLVEWSTKPNVSIGWTLLTSPADVAAFANKVRSAKRVGDQFTCMSASLRYIADKVVPMMPVPADRVVVDVSGDGHDNCNPAKPVDTVSAELAAGGATVNGLPILEGDEAKTLEGWYSAHVIAGVGAFVLPAAGFDDISRAMRQKFVTEISGVPTGNPRFASAGRR